MPKKKTILVDFDGVLHSYKSGWQGARTISDAPVQGAIGWLSRMAADTRFEVAIYSSRSKEPGGIDAMIKWLIKHGLSMQDLNKISFPMQKPAAFVSLDDRAIQFKGRFPTPDTIDAFKSWID